MAHRTLEVTLQSAADLNKVNLLTKMDVYAVVSISGGDKNTKQKIKSPVDRDGDTNPTWNFPMKFTIDEAALRMNRLTLDFKLVCQRAFGDRDVGQVIVPIKELLDTKGGADGKVFVSYQVRKSDGKPKGQLSFSYKFSEKNIVADAGAPAYGSGVPMAPPPVKDDHPVMAYPAGPGSSYPHAGMYPPPAQYARAEGSGVYPPPTEVYPPHPQAGYGYTAPPPTGYGYPPPPPPGYGYPPQAGYGYPPQPVVQPARKNKFGMGLGAGLLGGALGGLLIGDAISDGGDFGGGFDC